MPTTPHDKRDNRPVSRTEQQDARGATAAGGWGRGVPKIVVVLVTAFMVAFGVAPAPASAESADGLENRSRGHSELYPAPWAFPFNNYVQSPDGQRINLAQAPWTFSDAAIDCEVKYGFFSDKCSLKPYYRASDYMAARDKEAFYRLFLAAVRQAPDLRARIAVHERLGNNPMCALKFDHGAVDHGVNTALDAALAKLGKVGRRVLAVKVVNDVNCKIYWPMMADWRKSQLSQLRQDRGEIEQAVHPRLGGYRQLRLYGDDVDAIHRAGAAAAARAAQERFGQAWDRGQRNEGPKGCSYVLKIPCSN